MKRHRELIHISRLEARDLKVAAEDASGVDEGEEIHIKGTTATKKGGSMRN